MKILRKSYEFLIPCPESLGHRYGFCSGLCLNDGCNDEEGSWKPCKGVSSERKRLMRGIGD